MVAMPGLPVALRVFVAACAATAAVAVPVVPVIRAADRPVAWVAATGRLERAVNAHAARGLRVAAVSDGLPQAVIAMQAPDGDAPPAEYRVVGDKDLAAALQPLVDEGFVPVVSAQRVNAGAQVIFERVGTPRGRDEWHLAEFADFEALDAALASAAAEGYRARLLVQTQLKSWPGLSHRGLLLASRPTRGAARETRVVVHRSRNLDDAAAVVAAAASEGFELDLLFTSARDGSQQGRRERLVITMSRAKGATKAAGPVRLARTSSFGTFGSGVPLGAAPFWTDDYVYAWSPAERRQTWASPTRLSDSEGRGVNIELKLRIDGFDDQAWDIVGLLARPVPTGGFELVTLTDQWLGPRPGR